MKVNSFILYCTLVSLLLINLTLGDTVHPYCKVYSEYNNTKIFTSYGERFPYYLTNYFEGYNLQYSLDNGDFLISHNIFPGYELIKKYSTTNLQKQ